MAKREARSAESVHTVTTCTEEGPSAEEPLLAGTLQEGPTREPEFPAPSLLASILGHAGPPICKISGAKTPNSSW